jgi:hypothetical protein
MIRLYPSAWRARYGEEFAALLADCPTTGRTAFDLRLAAADAHLQVCSRRLAAVLSRMKASAMIVFAAWVAYVLAGLVFYGILGDNPLTILARSQGGLHLAVLAVQAGAVLALLAIAAGALPVGWAVFRNAMAARRWGILALLAVPVAAAVVILACGILLVVVASPVVGLTAPTAASRALVYGTQFVFLIGAVASTVAVLIAFARTPLDEEPYRRYVRAPAIVATLAMGLTAAAVAAWGLAAWLIAPVVFRTTAGVFGLTTALAWLGVVLVMGLATTAAGISVRRGLAPS